MTDFAIKGWCPGALRPMLSGDGWVLRIRPRGGRLTPTQAHGVADLSRRYGNGMMDLTSRANLQLRGVAPDTHTALIHALRDLDLIDADEASEARRNIITSPFWTPLDATIAITAALETALASPDVPDLPGKFGFAVDIGAAPVLRAASADIRIEWQDGLILRPDGSDLAAPITRETLAAAVLGLAQWFVATGGDVQGRGRMAPHLARAQLPPEFRAMPQPPAQPARIGPHAAGWLTGIAFGQISADVLHQIAALGALRLTPWRMVLVEGMASPPQTPGLITDPADPMLNVTACTGAPGCPQAHQATRDLARSLAPQVPPGAHLHVSGCAKGCAHPGPATVTLTATPQGYDVIRQGRASDTPSGPYPQPLFKAE